MADACIILSEFGGKGIDVNMGCPNHDIVKKGQGAWLLTDIGKSREIIRACRKATNGLLSVKMRTGYEKNNETYFIDFVRMLQDEGTDFITIHPRPARLGFRRTADWRLVALAKRRITIPVVGNGDIDSPENAIKQMNDSGCDGIMIGREAVKSPWIFRLTADLMSGTESQLAVDVHDIFIRTLEFIRTSLPPHLHKSRGHRFSTYFSKNARYGHDLFTRIRRESSIPAMQDAVEQYYLRNKEEAKKKYIIANGRVFEERIPFNSHAGDLEPAGAVR